jgi:hypothetical protein
MTHHDMYISRRRLLGSLAAGSLQLLVHAGAARAAETQLTRAQKEEFLLKAKIVKTQSAPKGITETIRATLEDGTLTHEASIQVIDEYKTKFDSPRGTEMNFKDTWKFNLAAYKLDRLLGLNMVPVTVERRYRGAPGSFTWWVDDVLMDEVDRTKKKIEAPDAKNWNNQMHCVRVFDQLIFNVDRNLQNLLIDKDWQIWMIDHSRSFRMLTSLREAKNLQRCDQDLLEKLKQLNDATLKKELGTYLSTAEIKGLLARRDRIVKTFEDLGPSVLYTSPRRPD